MTEYKIAPEAHRKQIQHLAGRAQAAIVRLGAIDLARVKLSADLEALDVEAVKTRESHARDTAEIQTVYAEAAKGLGIDPADPNVTYNPETGEFGRKG